MYLYYGPKYHLERCSDKQRFSLLFYDLPWRCNLDNPAVDSIAKCLGLDSLGRKSYNGFNLEIEVSGSDSGIEWEGLSG